MILLAGGGFLVERFLAVPSAFAIGAIAGLMLAPLVPAPVACGIRGHRREKPEDESASGDPEADERAA